MKIITSFAALDLSPEDFPAEFDQFAGEDFQRIQNALIDAYADSSSGSSICEQNEPENFLFGRFSGSQFRKLVDDWNVEIKRAFLQALKGLCPSLSEGRMPDEGSLPTDCSETYILAGAARELDNVWYDYANHGVYLPNELGWPYFKTMLADYEKAQMFDNPSDYLVVKVSVK